MSAEREIPAEDSIKVVCRFRPLNDSEEKAGSKFVVKFPNNVEENCISIAVNNSLKLLIRCPFDVIQPPCPAAVVPPLCYALISACRAMTSCLLAYITLPQFAEQMERQRKERGHSTSHYYSPKTDRSWEISTETLQINSTLHEIDFPRAM